MKRVAVCGGEPLRAAARAVGLEEDDEHAELVLVEAADEAAVARARALSPALPRVFVADGPFAALLEAAGAAYVVSPPPRPSVLGPIIHTLERGRTRAPATIVVCAAGGASGRTSLVANLAIRVARRTPAIAIDATGSGALAWRLGVTVTPWTEIAAVGADLSDGHLRLAAAERHGLLVVGGVGAPDEDLVCRVVDLARSLGIVFVDAPAHRVPAALLQTAARIVVCSNPDPASVSATRALLEQVADLETQLLVSQAEERDARALTASFGRAPTYLLPRDESACRAAVARRGPISGRLGRAYDAIAEILLAEVVP